MLQPGLPFAKWGGMEIFQDIQFIMADVPQAISFVLASAISLYLYLVKA
jgi:hypothetical protein